MLSCSADFILQKKQCGLYIESALLNELFEIWHIDRNTTILDRDNKLPTTYRI
ncbi:MAG: hypothetical protein ACRC2R_26105 [Xenococcaceae cyanobacterium]